MRNGVSAAARYTSYAVGAAAAVALVFAATANAQIHALSDRLSLNSHTTEPQRISSIAMAADGNFVVVWQGNSFPGDDNYSEVVGRSFDPDAVPRGEDFLVHNFTPSNQFAPSVAADPDGGFVAAWVQFGGRIPGSSADSISMRLLDTAGNPTGPDFLVNTYSEGDQRYPQVAFGSDGGFLVVWRSDGSPGDDQQQTSIQARKFDAAAVPLGPQFQVNAQTEASEHNPQVAAANDGSFVVVWAEFASGAAGQEIRARRVSAQGVPLSGDIAVNTYTSNAQFRPAVAATPGGGFVVVWESYGSAGSDSVSNYNTSVQSRIFDAADTPAGPDMQVNVFTSGDQSEPSVAVDTAGKIVVIWTGETHVPTRDFGGMAGRALARDGTLIGEEFGIDVDVFSTPERPKLAVDGRNQFTVVWDGFSGGPDTDGGIYAKRFCLDLDANAACDGLICGEASEAVGRSAFRRTRAITATDALVVLGVAVGSAVCPDCVCDVNDDGGITATDALLVLQFGVGQNVDLQCPACA